MIINYCAKLTKRLKRLSCRIFMLWIYWRTTHFLQSVHDSTVDTFEKTRTFGRQFGRLGEFGFLVLGNCILYYYEIAFFINNKKCNFVIINYYYEIVFISITRMFSRRIFSSSLIYLFIIDLCYIAG